MVATWLAAWLAIWLTAWLAERPADCLPGGLAGWLQR